MLFLYFYEHGSLAGFWSRDATYTEVLIVGFLLLFAMNAIRFWAHLKLKQRAPLGGAEPAGPQLEVNKFDLREKALIGFASLAVVSTLIGVFACSGAIFEQWNISQCVNGTGASHLRIFFGIVVAGTGLAGLFQVHREMGRNWSHTLQLQNGHRLVTTGPFAFVRHPMYTSLLIYSFGMFIVFPSPFYLNVLYPVSMIVLYFGRIEREEDMLAEAFGDEWNMYCSAVRCRLCPHVV